MLHSPRQATGFTLVELILVIVIVGIVAATALPKLVNLSGDAKVAKMQGFARALRSGINVAVGRWQMAGQPAAGITMDDGTTITFTNGFPSSATVGNLLERTTTGVYVMSGGSGASFCNVEVNNNTACGSPPPLTGPAWLITQLRTAFTYCAFVYYPPSSAGANYTIDTSYLSNCTY